MGNDGIVHERHEIPIRDGHGVIAVRDESRAEAADALARIRSLGVSTMVLTGDNSRTGSAIAAKLGMEARSELLPQDKLRIIGRR